jgi:endonuclease G
MDKDNSRLLTEIRELVQSGDFALALDRIKAVSHAVSARLYDEVVLLQSRSNRLLRDYRKGIMAREHFDAELNRLAVSLLSLAEEISRDLQKTQHTPEYTSADRPAESFQELTQQQIIGINNLKQISWIETGLRAARSVCRILTPDGFGTGFLVGDGILLTNNHVITSADVASRSQAEFNYQQDESGGFHPTVRYELDSVGFHTNVRLDYSFVRIRQSAKKPPLSTWGVLSLNANADPTPSEHVIIVQHPNGGYKQIVLTANWVIAAQPPILHYTTDTMPGSSGSPVFNDSWHVIAIHHARGPARKDKQGSIRYVNEGILMSAIRDDAGTHWP